MYFKENHHTAIIKKEDWIKVQKLLSRADTAQPNEHTLRRLSNHFVAYRVKEWSFQGLSDYGFPVVFYGASGVYEKRG